MILEILNDMASNASRNYKLEVAQKHSSNDLLKRVVFLAYDPFTQFYIRKIPTYTPTPATAKLFSLESALNLLSHLSSRNVTGNAGIEHLRVILSNVTAEDAEVIERIIGKDLKVGASESTFNKVWPGLVHEYPCMLCSAYDKKLVDKIKFPALVQKKEDGMRFNAIVKNGDVEFRSRNGKEIQLLGNLEQEFLVMANGSNIVFDGELLVANEDGTIADRQTGNGILNKANKGTITPELAKMVRAQIWDMIDYDKFHAGVDNTPYIDRWNKLLGCTNTSNGKIGYVETIVVANLEAAEVQFEAYLEDGFEGIILKDSNAIWEDKRSKKQVKFKGEEEADLLVYDVYLGEPGSKYEGMIGGVSVKSRDGILKVNVGSGFSDEQRKQDPALLMNKIVAVKYNMGIKNKQGEESLFLPIFIEVREDKDLADTNEMIK
jgi:hypothetical protein